VVGTPGYLSPEVCLGNPVDARSDLFALGIVLFEMLSGHLPFENASPLKLMLSVVESDIPDIRTLNNDVDLSTVKILNLLLAKDPEDRYQSASELLSDLHVHPALQDNTQLSVHARLPSGAASTVLATPGLAKASAKIAPGTDVKAPAISIAVPPNDAFVIKKTYLLLGLFLLSAAAGAFWWFNKASENVAPTEILTSTETKTTPAITPAPVTTLPVAPTPVAVPDHKAIAPAAVVEKPGKEKEAPLPTKEMAAIVKPNVVVPAPKAAEPMQKYGSVYAGEHNEQLEIAHVDGKDVAYLRITGINHPLDGKVIRATFRPAAYEGRDYVIQNHGRDYVMVVNRKNYKTNEMRTEVYVPDLDNIGDFTYDSELSRQLDTEKLRADYREK
jgi:Protein kinase domain